MACKYKTAEALSVPRLVGGCIEGSGVCAPRYILNKLRILGDTGFVDFKTIFGNHATEIGAISTR